MPKNNYVSRFIQYVKACTVSENAALITICDTQLRNFFIDFYLFRIDDGIPIKNQFNMHLLGVLKQRRIKKTSTA